MALKLAGNRGERALIGYVDFPENTGACTICCWVKITDFAIDGQRIICKATSGTYYWVIDVLISGGENRFRARLRTGTTTYTATAASHIVSSATIYFVVLRYDGTNLKLYANISEIASTAVTGNVAVNSSVMAYIGDNPENVVRSFKGTVGDVRIYTKALSLNEMSTIYFSQGDDCIIDSLLYRWKMDENYIGSKVFGVGTLTDLAPLKQKIQAESAGKCLEFSRASSRKVQCANVNSDYQVAAPFTVQAWIKVNNFADWSASSVNYSVGNIVAYGGDFWECIQAHTSQANWYPGNVPSLWDYARMTIFGTKNGTNGFELLLIGAAIGMKANATEYNSANTIVRNTWTNIGIVVNSTNVKIYKNGVNISSPTFLYSIGTTLSGAQIGASGASTNYFDGRISTVRFFKASERTTAQMEAYQYEQVIPASSSQKGQWLFNEGEGTSAADSTGNGHTGTIDSSSMWVEDNPIACPIYDAELTA